jgi:transposase-like protein/IS1 family transposase
MNLSELAAKYNTEEKCLAQIQKIKWGEGNVCCFHCGAMNLTRRKNSIKWHCNSCNKDSSVLMGTIFERSHMPLTKWFQLIYEMLIAKNGISAKEIANRIGVTYKTAWYSAMRVRCAMLDWGDMLEGIVEMDETYVGGKPRKRNNQPGVTEENTADLGNLYSLDDKRIKRGRGTKKVPIAGIVERKGKVVAKVMNRLTSQDLISLLKKTVKLKSSTLITDDYRAYKKMDELIERFVINHSQKEYARGAVHTNTIEGFWSIIKNGIRGSYHVISKKYLPFYLAEFTYRYNRRQLTISDSFWETVDNTVVNEKCFNKYKPKRDVKKIVYGKKKQRISKCTIAAA